MRIHERRVAVADDAGEEDHEKAEPDDDRDESVGLEAFLGSAPLFKAGSHDLDAASGCLVRWGRVLTRIVHGIF
mgnify:CR=1 FL=1